MVVVIVLSSAVFALDSVSIVFHNQTNILSGDENVIIESGNFRYGENVFLSNKKQYVNNIESANPYIMVLNIETKFPNKYIVHAVEREPVFVFQTNNKYTITDEYLKVLKRETELEYNNSRQNAIEIFNSEYSNVTVKEGDFFAKNTYYYELFHCFKENIMWESSADIKANIKCINLNYVDGLNSGENNLLITMWDDVEILISASNKNMSNKLNFAFSAYYQVDDANRISIYEKSNGEIVCLYS